MIYQERKSIPYSANVRHMGTFQPHKHPDIELLLCTDGEFIAFTDDEEYLLQSGDILFVRSMATHGIKGLTDPSESLIINIGPVFSPQCFSQVERLSPHAPFISHSNTQNNVLMLRGALNEVIDAVRNKREASELLIIGNLYRACAFLVDIFSTDETLDTSAVEYSKAYYAIEKAIETVHTHYNDPITIEHIAEATGYSKSSFCNLFKSSIGIGFHNYLNDFRIKNACYLLNSGDMSISEIAETVGFSDVKTFYRAFRRVTGKTPGAFRKNAKKQ